MPAAPQEAIEVEQAAEPEQAAAEDTRQEPAHPPANPNLAALYGDSSLPTTMLIDDVPISAVVAACWPDKSPAVRSAHLCAAEL